MCAVDPGNWATDLAAGSAYGYDLLAAILLANICAIFFQVRHPPCFRTVRGIAMPAWACNATSPTICPCSILTCLQLPSTEKCHCSFDPLCTTGQRHHTQLLLTSKMPSGP